MLKEELALARMQWKLTCIFSRQSAFSTSAVPVPEQLGLTLTAVNTVLGV